MVVAFHISGGCTSAETGGFLYGKRRGKKMEKEEKIFFSMEKEEKKKYPHLTPVYKINAVLLDTQM